MSILDITDTKQLYLNSISNNKTINLNYPLNSHIRYLFHDITDKSDFVLYSSVKLSHAEIPYSFYIINEYNNILNINDTLLNIPYGNYNALNLQTEIKRLLTENNINIDISFNTSNGKYTFSSSTQFTIKQSTIYNIIGLESGNYTSIIDLQTNLYIIECSYPVNTGGSKNIYIKTNFITDNKQSLGNNNGILKSIPVNVPPFGIIMYNNNENIETIIKNKEMPFLDIEILDDNNNYIDFNGLDWSICLEIKTYKKYLNMKINLETPTENNNK